MREERAGASGNGRTPGVCANEGCGRPATGELCDACALEWALFHREERGEICRAVAEPFPAARLARRSE
jgi:hypothetical protein